MKLLSLSEEYIDMPVLSGSFNDWKSVPMFKVHHLAQIMDKNRKRPLEELRER